MGLPGPLVAFLLGVLASSPFTDAHAGHARPKRLAHAPRDLEVNLKLNKRVGAGAGCGPGAGGAVCDAGLCCSEEGFCGTGGAFCSAPACQLSYSAACDGNQVPSGPDTSKTPRPKFGSVAYGVDITGCINAGQMSLTFDDGPYIYTNELLDLLKKNGVRATFFINGNNGAKGQINNPSSGYAPIVQRMVADGHQIASHGWSHQDLVEITPTQRRNQIVYNEIAIADIIGGFPTYFRPPYTSCDAGCYNALGDMGYHVVNYDIDTKDFEDGGSKAKTIYSSALASSSSASTGWITLAHDIHAYTVKEFAQYMINLAKEKGYSLVTTGECLNDPPANWYRDPSTGQPRAVGAANPPTPPIRIETSTTKSDEPSKTETKTSSSSSSSSSSTSKPVVTPTAVPSGTDFGTNTKTHKPQNSSTTVAPPASGSSEGPSTSTTPPAAGSAAAPLATPFLVGGNIALALMFGFVGVLFFMS
ncbi:hypothetical protein OQA88_877 [Cercophora sp. LCS_1]